MSKYRKKPVVVEAWQWFPQRLGPGVHVETEEEATSVVGKGRDYEMTFRREPRRYVVTIHGQRAYLEPGDWVIAESDGEHFYPCKPAEFDRIYEPVDA
jgi:hypothetical protein